MTANKKRKFLAINGGKPVMKKPLPRVHIVGREELSAVTRVLREGPLSDFHGTAGSRFLGGREVRAFENEFAEKFKVKYAVSFNSATTALHGAIVALGIGPGDEVIVPPYTMAASAIAVLMNGAVPIFADIDPRTFCIDVDSVRKRITKRTKAIMAVDLLGQGPDFAALLPLAKKHHLAIIEDNAQSPGAKWRKKYLGTIGHIGVFSLNIHKIVQTGEGGVLVTNDKGYALRAQLSRNHGESVVDEMDSYNAGPIIGSNYRMTEVVAAIARTQLHRLDHLIKKRRVLAAHLEKALAQIPGLTAHYTHPDNTNVYYRYAIMVDEKKIGLSRDKLVKAMAAEGFQMSRGYVKPIYLMKIFQERKAFNKSDFPFGKSKYYDGNPDYSKGLCPVTERLHEKEFTFTDVCQHPYTTRHVDLFVKALKKVIAHRHELN